MNNFKYDANIGVGNLTIAANPSVVYGVNFDENSTITQMTNLQMMMVNWVNDNGEENKIILNIDFYNEKVYTMSGVELPSDLLFTNAVKDIIKNKKRNILNTPSPDKWVENTTQVARELLNTSSSEKLVRNAIQEDKGEPSCQND